MQTHAPESNTNLLVRQAPPRKRVLLVSTSYPSGPQDWKGVFIRHMASALGRLDGMSLRLWHPPGEFAANSTYVATLAEAQWLEGLMDAGGIAHLLRTRPASGLSAALHLLTLLRRLYRRESGIDLYHVNWLQNALPLPRDSRPLLVTVLGTDMQLLRIPGIAAGLRRAFGGRRVAICPNAEWMVAELARRLGDVADVTCVPFGIDSRWFDTERQLERPAKWLCVSRVTEGKIGTLFEWCEPHFRTPERELHLIGPMQQELPIPDWVHYHGAADPDALRTRWFPTAHGLITLSQHAEGRPQVLLEAMAAGLPIIASPLPAHRDILADGRTGWIVGDSDAVGSALTASDDLPANQSMGKRAQQWAREEIGTWDDCARRYEAVYRSLQEPRA
jgi:hypothetical protein